MHPARMGLTIKGVDKACTKSKPYKREIFLKTQVPMRSQPPDKPQTLHKNDTVRIEIGSHCPELV